MTDLTALQRAIQQTIRRQLTGVCTCEWYPVMRQALLAPAVLLELVEGSPAENAGTDQLSLHLRFEARVVMAHGTPDAVLATPALAVQLACLIETNTWDGAVTPARVMQVLPDGFRPELEAYCVWQVEWQQQGRFGPSVWTGGTQDTVEPTPHPVIVGLEPTDADPVESSPQNANATREKNSIVWRHGGKTR